MSLRGDERGGSTRGHTLALAAAGALLVFATGTPTAALHSLLGIADTALAALLFLAIGNPLRAPR